MTGRDAIAGQYAYQTGADVAPALMKLYQMQQAALDTSNTFGLETNQANIASLYKRTAAEAGALEQMQALRNIDQATRNIAMADRQNRVALGNTLARSGSSKGSKGLAAAAMLQAMGQQQQMNANTMTGSVQDAQNIGAKTNQAITAAEMQALADANKAKQQVGQLATDKYIGDSNVYAQSLLGLSNLAGVLNTNRTNTGINNALNKTNASIVNAQNKWNFLTYKG